MWRDNPGRSSGDITVRPAFLLWHGSRSGVPKSIKAEFDGTRVYAMNSLVTAKDGSTYYTGWHLTVGENEYAVHMTPRRFGWNAGNDSRRAYAVELAQWQVTQAITDAEIRTAAVAVVRELVPVWGDYDWDDPGLHQLHSERPQGIEVGKTDCYPRFDPRAADFKRRMILALTAVAA